MIAALASLVVLNAASAQQPNVEGCFVHAFAQAQYGPPMTTYTGPTHEPVLMPQASSLIVGPGARLLGYAGKRYRNETLDLAPGARVPDLAAIGFDRQVDSFKVVCGDGDAVRG